MTNMDFGLKKFTSISNRLTTEMNRCLQEADTPEWITKGKTTLIQKDLKRGTVPNNYRPITNLPIMWKIQTAQIREEIYNSLIIHGLFPEKQKGCCKGTRGTGNYYIIHNTSSMRVKRDEKMYFYFLKISELVKILNAGFDYFKLDP